MADEVVLPETEAFREFATRLGCQPGYVTGLRKAGRLVLTQDGRRVRVSESLQLIADTRNPGKAGGATRQAAPRGAESMDADPAASTSATDDAPDRVDYSDPLALRRSRAQAEREEAMVRKALREEQVELGDLLRRDDAVAALSDAVVQLRRRLDQLPATLAPELAATNDEARCASLLRDGVEQALSELSRKFAAIGKQA